MPSAADWSSGRTDSLIQQALDRIHAGDQSAKNDLLAYAERQLRRMTRQKFSAGNSLRRWEQTDDVLQGVHVRLSRMLDQLGPDQVDSPRRFFALAAKNLIWEIKTLADRHRSLQAHYQTDVDPTATDGPSHGGQLKNAAGKKDPDAVVAFAQLFEGMKGLAEEDQEILKLIFANGCTNEEAADTLGLTLSTFKRRYREARLRLKGHLRADSPTTAQKAGDCQ
jgi:RNA polymerase sigma factor (sigma-70 family)